MRDAGNYITTGGAALGPLDRDLVEAASRRFRTKSGRASNRGCLGIGGSSTLSPEIVKLF